MLGEFLGLLILVYCIILLLHRLWFPESKARIKQSKAHLFTSLCSFFQGSSPSTTSTLAAASSSSSPSSSPCGDEKDKDDEVYYERIRDKVEDVSDNSSEISAGNSSRSSISGDSGTVVVNKEDAAVRKKFRSRSSAMDLVTQQGSMAGGRRSMWAELPEVIESGILGKRAKNIVFSSLVYFAFLSFSHDIL